MENYSKNIYIQTNHVGLAKLKLKIAFENM